MTGSRSGESRGPYCIIHGHFYQPPRENPWTNVLEAQPSAAPFHDWNERAFHDCYRPNAYSRLLDARGMIHDIHNNYRHLSYNFGPTLFRWLERKHPVVAQRILDADHDSCDRLDGHGNAIAQVYNHIILPLASRRDQLTQVRWARSFFKSRFAREPEGIWLSETAINNETVKVLVEEGIRFVVLSPTQAKGCRRIGDGHEWVDTADQMIDTRRAYRVYLSGDSTADKEFLSVFFFDQGLSRAASFGDLLTNAELLCDRIGACFSGDDNQGQAVIMATDGETFGHHKPFADMCLARFFTHTAPRMGFEPVSFGYFLAKHPAEFEVKLKNAGDEGSSWSCAHGTGRWQRDCGCRTGGEEEWNQEWRTPLRQALEELQQSVDTEYAERVGEIVPDPWRLRDACHDITEPGTDGTVRRLLSEFGASGLPDEEERCVIRLLGAQKYMLFAFTSCGWFFSDISGIETVQNLMYACRAAQLGLSGPERRDALDQFLKILATARSNLPGQTGRTVCERQVLPFLRHLAILCFTSAAARTVLGVSDNPVTLFDYSVFLRPCAGLADKTAQCFSARISNDSTGEEGEYSVLLCTENLPGTYGYVVCGRDSPASADPKLWSERPDALRLELHDLFQSSKTAFAEHFMDRITEQARPVYESLMSQAEAIVSCLGDMSCKLHEHLRGAVAHLLTTQWNEVIASIDEGHCGDKEFAHLLELRHRAERLGVQIDYQESTRVMQRLLLAGMNEFAVALSPASSGRIRYLLNIVDRFGMPVSKSGIEDTFYETYRTGMQSLYEECHADASPPERKTLLLQALIFARRMNFSTERFPPADR